MHMPQKGFRQHTYEVPGLESEDPFAYGLQTIDTCTHVVAI